MSSGTSYNLRTRVDTWRRDSVSSRQKPAPWPSEKQPKYRRHENTVE